MADRPRPDQEITAERVDTPVPRPLARIRGRLDTLLEESAYAVYEGSWIEATLTDPVRPEDPMARLAARFPHTLSLAFDPEGREEAGGASYAQRLKGRSDQEIAEDFVAHVRGGGVADEAERAVLQGAFEDVRADDTRQETRR